MILHVPRHMASLAVLIAMFGYGTARAESEDTRTMPLGAATTAPTGFLEMCERTPTECLTETRPTDRMFAEVQTQAGQAR